MEPGKILNINRLSTDELTYELAIRGVGSGTCDVMRKQLASLRKLEKSGDSFTYPPYPFTHEEDREAVTNKLDTEVVPMMEGIEGDPNSGAVLKMQSKLAHLLGRVDRMPAESKDEKTVRAGFLGKILTRFADLDEKIATWQQGQRAEREMPTSLNLMENMQTSSRAEHDDIIPTEPYDMPRHSSIIPPSTQPPRSIPVNKWNLTFSGDRKGMSVNAFLERVDELRIARNVSKETLFDSGVDLFSGKALHWYRYAKKTETTWDGLVQRLREEFQPNNYTEKLFEEIKKRTQGQDESVGIYLAIMSAMFDRLECPVTEQTRLKIIMRNLAPFYQSQLGLVDVKSISELKSLCRRLEERREAVESYVPPTSRKTTLEPDFAYLEYVESVPVVDAVDTNKCASKQATKISMKCFNCNREGHKAAGCLEPKRLRCYRCNLEGYTKRTCPKCSESGNGNRRH